ncbi:MAG: N-formylglutamate amidohydrolase, partial [Rhizobium sp.]
DILDGLGFHAVRNKPYAGGFITEHYGRPSRGLHALQVEVNRALYVDEATLQKRADFGLMTGAITAFMRQMAEHVANADGNRALAAE